MDRPNLPLQNAHGIETRLAAAAAPLLADVNASQARTITEHARAVLACFLPTKELITNIDEQGLCSLAAMCVSACIDPEYLDDLEIRVGYGGAPLESPNVRVASYLVAPKTILRELQTCRRNAEMFHILEQIGHCYPQSKVAKVKAAVMSQRPLSDQQQVLYGEIGDTVQSLPEYVDLSRTTPFPKYLPRVVVYSAHEFLGRVNGQVEQVRQCAETTQEVLRRYIDTTCPPEIAKRFEFDSDFCPEEDSLLNRQLDYWADAVARSPDAAAVDVRDKIARLGTKHGGDAESGLQYAVAHVAYSSDDIDGPAVSILRKTEAMPAKLMMIGGPPEKLFWKVRQTVCKEVSREAGIEHLRNQALTLRSEAIRTAAKQLMHKYEAFSPPEESRRRVQLISRVGEIPVYSAELSPYEPSCREAHEQGIQVEDIVELENIRTSVKEDLIVLLQDILKLDIADVRNIAKGKQSLAVDATRMEKAQNTLKAITNPQ